MKKIFLMSLVVCLYGLGFGCAHAPDPIDPYKNTRIKKPGMEFEEGSNWDYEEKK